MARRPTSRRAAPDFDGETLPVSEEEYQLPAVSRPNRPDQMSILSPIVYVPGNGGARVELEIVRGWGGIWLRTTLAFYGQVLRSDAGSGRQWVRRMVRCWLIPVRAIPRLIRALQEIEKWCENNGLL